MESFGINIDCDEELKVIRKESFTNFLRDDITDGMKLPLKNLVEVRKPYVPTPILFSRFHMLDFNTHLMEDNSVITNCRTLSSLAQNRKCKYVLFPAKIDRLSKTFYILHAENDGKPPETYHKNLHIGKRLEATLKKEVNNFQTFACFHKKIDDPLMNIYYTHQIDLYDSQRNPIEVKALRYYDNSKNFKKTAKQKLAECYGEDKKLNTLFQCIIGKVENIILGLHDGNETEIIQINVKELMDKVIAGKVEEGIAIMENGLKECIKKYNQKYKGQIVRMQHIELRTKKEWMFTPINFEELSSFDKEFLLAI